MNNNSANLVSNKNILNRFIVLAFCAIAIFGSAASCDFNNLFGDNNANLRYGILKSDPSVLENGFGFINTVRKYNDDLDSNALNSHSGIKMIQRGKDEFYYITQNKGLLFTNSGGREWNRIYITNPINANSIEEQDRQISNNDQFKMLDIAFTSNSNNEQFYVTGYVGENSVIYKTNDSGKSFLKVYDTTSSGKKVYIEQLLTDGGSEMANVLWAFTNSGNILKTTDGGLTWAKTQRRSGEGFLNIGADTPLQVGNLKGPNGIGEDGWKYFAIYQSSGIEVSKDGNTFYPLQIKQSSTSDSQNSGAASTTNTSNSNTVSSSTPTNQNISQDPNEQPWVVNTSSIGGSGSVSGSSSTLGNNGGFSNFLISSSTYQPKRISQSENGETLIISNEKVYIASTLSGEYIEMKLPVDSASINITDAVFDPLMGSSKVFVSVNKQLFESINRGQTWSANDKVNQKGVEYGNLGQITIDKFDNKKIYLMLVNPTYKRGESNWLGL
jgi:hypothetical protein